jgi:hypothetical protein
MAGNLTPGQRKVLAQIQAAPSYKRASPKVRKALIEAAIVESNLSTPNQAQSDRDSEGVLQQRPSSGWGPTSESNTTDAEQFLQRAMKVAGKYGNAGALAQAVQRSAFPGRYNQRGGEAAALLGDTSAGPVASAASAGGSRGSTRTTVTKTPGVDNRIARAALIQSFLEDKSSDPVEFAAQANALKDIAPSSETKTVRIPGAAATPSGGGASGAVGGSFGKDHSPLLELIHNTGSGPGYAVKDGKKVNGPQFYSGVWAGHANHVHVAAGPKTIVALGKLAKKMGLSVSENPHFGGVSPVHVPGSYHYRGEAVDVSGDPKKMNEYARRVEAAYGLR